LQLYQNPNLINMKLIVLFACAIALITTTGCFHGGRGGHWHDRGDVRIARPEVAVRAPEVIVTPTLVAVNAPAEIVVR
jgi:hypothetical protein